MSEYWSRSAARRAVGVACWVGTLACSSGATSTDAGEAAGSAAAVNLAGGEGVGGGAAVAEAGAVPAGAGPAAGASGAAGTLSTAAGAAGEPTNAGGAGAAGTVDDDPSLPDAGANAPDLSLDAGAGGNLGVGSDMNAEPDGNLSAGPLEFVAEPLFGGNPNPAAPLAGVVTATIGAAAILQITVTGGGEEWTVESPTGVVHEKPILGLKADTEYQVQVVARNADTEASFGPLSWTSPALPANFPPLEVVASEPENMEPGMTLFNAREARDDAWLIVVDATGEVRWYYYDTDIDPREDHRLLANGNLLFNADHRLMFEVDLLGNVVGRWHAANYPEVFEAAPDSVPVAVDSFSHEVSMVSDDTFLVLSTQATTVEDFPSSDTNANAATSTATVVGDLIAEFTRNGEMVKTISLFDIIDPRRVGRDSLIAPLVPYGQGSRDWSHSNAVVYDAASDCYYVSVRHQDAVLKINRTTEELVWILGTPANWNAPWSEKLLAPSGDLLWSYHQHAVELTPYGLGLYDNGNYRAAAFEEASASQFSRAVIYTIDEANMTVSQEWSYGAEAGDDSFYSAAMGDADWQPVTGNVLMTNAQVSAGGGMGFGGGSVGQLLEVTRDGRRVFHLNVGGNAGGGGPGAGGGVNSTYRAQHIPDLRR